MGEFLVMDPKTLPGEVPKTALGGILVADLSESVAGRFSTRLMADQGAAVVLFESQGDARSRITTERGRSAHLFRHVNSGKVSSVLPADPVEGVLAFQEEVGVVFHVVVVSDFQREAAVAERLPRAIVANVTDFPKTGPYSNWLGSELILQALSGSMFYNGRANDVPLYGVGYRASYEAGLHLYTRILSQLLAAPSEGEATGPLRVSAHEAAASMEQNFSTQWAYSATIPARGEWNRPKGRVRCKDGWMVFFASKDRLRELFEAFDAGDLYGDPRFSGEWTTFVRNIALACEIFTERAHSLTQAELLQRALRDKLVLSPVRRLEDLRHDEQLVARGFWQSLEGESGAERREVLALGPMWRGRDHTVRDDPAPAPGERLRSWSWRSADGPPITPLRRRDGAKPLWQNAEGKTGPLVGVRVVDLTSAWAGPMATRILAGLGAEVIKIEGPERYDGWRGDRTKPFHLDSYPRSEPGVLPYNRNAWFNTQNPGKRTIGLDLKSERGIRILLDLVAHSDVVISNFSAGTMDRMGLGYGVLKSVNENIISVEMSGFGDSGPLKHHRGLGQTMEALAGITSLIGYESDGEPLGSGSAYLDPYGGLVGAAATLTALVSLARFGSGQRVDVPQREAAMHLIGELVLDAAESGRRYRPSGNSNPDAFPHEAFRCHGLDQWLALAVFTEEQWRSLCAVLDLDRLGSDPDLATLEGRRARSEEVLQHIGARLADRDKAQVAAQLQRAGVPAAPVQNGKDLFRDEQLRSREWFTRLPHRDAGTHEYPGIPVEIDEALARPVKAAPRLGEDTRAILGDLLGVPPGEIEALHAEKVIVCA